MSTSSIVDVNCRSSVAIKTAAASPKLIPFDLCRSAHVCLRRVYGAGDDARINGTTASFGNTTPGPSSRSPASIDDAMPPCTVTAVLSATAAIATDLVIHPDREIFRQVVLPSVANQRKEI